MPDLSSTPTQAVTAMIAAAYVATHKVEARTLSELVRSIAATVARLSEAGLESGARAPIVVSSVTPPRAVHPGQSVFPSHLLCIVCGYRVTLLRPHLRKRHALTPEQYRARFQLPAHYPMTAPNHSAKRADIARDQGLGRKPGVRVPSNPETGVLRRRSG